MCKPEKKTYLAPVAGIILLSLGLVACGDQSAAPNGEMNHEMGEPDAALTAQILEDDVAYLTQLGLMRGHLHVGVGLYDMGEHAEAATHMKHPESELYAELVPGMERRGAAGFADELAALATAVENGEDNAQVQQLYTRLEQSIREAEAAAADLDTSETGDVIAGLLSHVAEEYEIAVSSEGRMQNVHEYQDSLGFVYVARGYADQLPQTELNANQRQGLRTQFDFLQTVFADLMPADDAILTPPDTVNQIIRQLAVTLSGF